MSANTTPKFIDAPIIGIAEISTINTNRDGTGTMVVVATGTVAGQVIELVRVVAIVTTTAGMVRLFLNNGATKFLYKELTVAAVTASATVPAFEKEFVPTGGTLTLPTGWTLEAATEKGEAFKVFAFGGNL